MKRSFAIITLVGLVLVFIAVVMVGLNLQKSNNAKNEAKEVQLIITSIGAKYEESHLPAGNTALDLVSLNHNITKKHAFIECIDNICADSGYWWKFLVNGKESSESAFFYKVRGGDAIEFRFAKK